MGNVYKVLDVRETVEVRHLAYDGGFKLYNKTVLIIIYEDVETLERHRLITGDRCWKSEQGNWYEWDTSWKTTDAGTLIPGDYVQIETKTKDYLEISIIHRLKDADIKNF